VCTVALLSFLNVLRTLTETPAVGFAGVRVVVLVDNNPYKHGLETAWGLSLYVEVNETCFLFDAGPDPRVLGVNAVRLGVDLSRVGFVVVSHAHRDHVGGLKLVSSIKPGLRVYIPPDAGLARYVGNLSLRPVTVNETAEVSGGVYVVKPLYGPPVEEAVAIKTGRGLVILVGCSHPGVVDIVKQAVGDAGLNPYMVIGGLHMSGAPYSEVVDVVTQLIKAGVRKIYPLHCSGDGIREYVAEHYADIYGGGGAGLEAVIR